MGAVAAGGGRGARRVGRVSFYVRAIEPRCIGPAGPNWLRRLKERGRGT